MRIKVNKIGLDHTKEDNIKVEGWVRSVRKQASFTFVALNDGSCQRNFQIVIDGKLPDYETVVDQITNGCSISAIGKIVESPGKGQSVEMHAETVTVLGACDGDLYPLGKKRHTFEHLRTIAHLRPRTNTIGSVMRVRSALSFATHAFFQQKGFINLHTPIITASDCEGGGDAFCVTTLDPTSENPAKGHSADFFGQKTFLTVSGQLNAEAVACALSDVYTFGPTFRAENSHTTRHLAEFWMIEPEMAFADLHDAANLAEEYVKFCLNYALETCREDLEFFNQFIEKGLIDKLEHVASSPFQRLTYSEAIDILENAKDKFEYPVSWGVDLQTEHERYLAENHFKKPVILTDYPRSIKAFYMRDNEDGKTVAAMDILVPKIGELIGGSQREERKEQLLNKIKEFNLPPEEYSWYLELREFGSVPHAGFGLGFERLVQFVTGMENIRDVIPFPRTPGTVVC